MNTDSEFMIEYNKKLHTMENIIATLKKNATIGLPIAVSQPLGLLEKLGNRCITGEMGKLKVYYFHAEDNLNNTILDEKFVDFIDFYCLAMQHKERIILDNTSKHRKKNIHFIPNSFSQIPDFFNKRIIDLDAFLVTVSPMDEHGYFSFGLGCDYSMAAAKNAKRLIVEVNENMPRVFGANNIHISKVDSIVECNVPIQEMNPSSFTGKDLTIAKTICDHIPDGATLQIGAGKLPEAITKILNDKNDLGIHSELMTAGLMNLIRNGNINGSKKVINKNKHVFTVCYGTRELYNFLHNNMSIETRPVDYVNDPHVISKNNDVISVCGILEMDLYGQTNAESLQGRQVGGAGGQNDFVRGARHSKRGKSFLAFKSTNRDESISRIVPSVNGFVTDLRMDVDYVVTEYGCINLFGLSTLERAKALISIAHPRFRDELSFHLDKKIYY